LLLLKSLSHVASDGEFSIREIGEIRGPVLLVAAGRAGPFAPFRGYPLFSRSFPVAPRRRMKHLSNVVPLSDYLAIL
jgi:hypothetical protein